ncbi:hypothetical protein Aph01nite_50700 [Acrocarpospora phusangensis]|uniref:Uncharacterized protein n=1 Tax=Acrocarpospora phusangensis TaxID=1070424 RepID=A0A919QG36_9ACTN|nr:hypothetical protein [Acrocarpospora phusangensis]GIH26760.1 hypothetical protein Aph01nite_50700 [Acrocarpospora phusangensis]
MTTLEDRVTALEEEVGKMRDQRPEAEETRAIADFAQKSSTAAHATFDEVYKRLGAYHREVSGQFQRVNNALSLHMYRFGEVDNTLADHTDRLVRIETTQEEQAERLGRIEQVQKEHSERFDGLDERIDRVEGSQKAGNQMLQKILETLSERGDRA